MKKDLLVCLVFVLLIAGFNLGISATGFNVTNGVITSTGITGINCGVVTQEIFVVTGGTNTAFVNWTSSTAVSNTDFALGKFGQSDVIWNREEFRTSYFSIMQNTPPVHIRWQFKW